MPTGGIIFLTILALWAFYLVPVLVKERSSRLEGRAGDRTSPAVRVLQRPPAQRPSHRVVLTADRPVVSDDLPARPTRDLAVRLREDAHRTRLAVRARAVGALLGVVALLVVGVGAVTGAMPVWAPVVAVVWLGAVLASGAAATRSRRGASAPAARTVALPPRAHRVATEVFDGRVSRLSAPPAARTAPPLTTSSVEADRQPGTASDGFDAVVDGSWTPVEVPAPVYASKPVSRRAPSLPWSLPPVAGEPSAPLALGGADASTTDVDDAPEHDHQHDHEHQDGRDVEPVEHRRSASA